MCGVADAHAYSIVRALARVRGKLRRSPACDSTSLTRFCDYVYVRARFVSVHNVIFDVLLFICERVCLLNIIYTQDTSARRGEEEGDL